MGLGVAPRHEARSSAFPRRSDRRRVRFAFSEGLTQPVVALFPRFLLFRRRARLPLWQGLGSFRRGAIRLTDPLASNRPETTQ